MLTDVSEDLDLSYLSKIDMGVGSCSLGRSRWRHMTDKGGKRRNDDKGMRDGRSRS